VSAPTPDPSARRAATLRSMAWMLAAGVQFALLNAIARMMTESLEPPQVQFLRYLAVLAVMLPWMLRSGLAHWKPHDVKGQFWRGAVHTAGLLMWFLALPHVPLADITAIGFTTPLFIMAGAMVFLREPFVGARWVAAGIGLIGVCVVLWPKLSGGGDPFWSLVMLASTPVFAASFLITKALTRRDRPEVIVAWQGITISLLTLPFALPGWTWPSAEIWVWALLAGLLGSCGHYCMTEALRLADTSATQPVRFLDLLWASLTGFVFFAEAPTAWTFAGAAIILASTTWIARRESRRG